jgi:hypothetical protein
VQQHGPARPLIPLHTSAMHAAAVSTIDEQCRESLATGCTFSCSSVTGPGLSLSRESSLPSGPEPQSKRFQTTGEELSERLVRVPLVDVKRLG